MQVSYCNSPFYSSTHWYANSYRKSFLVTTRTAVEPYISWSNKQKHLQHFSALVFQFSGRMCFFLFILFFVQHFIVLKFHMTKLGSNYQFKGTVWLQFVFMWCFCLLFVYFNLPNNSTLALDYFFFKCAFLKQTMENSENGMLWRSSYNQT